MCADHHRVHISHTTQLIIIMRAQLHKPSANPNDDSEKAIKANVIEWNELVEKFVRSASIPQPYKPYTRAIFNLKRHQPTKKKRIKSSTKHRFNSPIWFIHFHTQVSFPQHFHSMLTCSDKIIYGDKVHLYNNNKNQISVFQIYVRAKTRQIYLLCWSGQQLPYNQVRSNRTGSTQFSSIYTVFSVAKQSHLLLKARRSRTAADFYRV